MKTVIVLGTARSGTSMISGLIHHLGVDMNPENNPSSQNPHGSYEDRNMISLTTNIIIGEDLDRHVQNMTVYLRHRMSEGRDWGFKSALSHEIWDHIDKSIFEDLYIVCNSRSVLTNTKSWLLHLRETYGTHKSLEDGILHIQRSNGRLFELVNRLEYKKIFTCYEEIKSNPNKVVEEMAHFLGIDLTEDIRVKINNFILPGYSTITSE